MHPHHVIAILTGLGAGVILGYAVADNATVVSLPPFSWLKSALAPTPTVTSGISQIISGTQNAISGLLNDFGLNGSGSLSTN